MHSPSDDADLIREAKAASPEAWARIYDDCARRIYLYAFGRTGNRQIAEDVTSTVFLNAFKSISSYDPSRQRLLPWLYGVARHALVDHLRKARPTVNLDNVQHGAAPDQAVEGIDLRATIAKLPGTQQEVVALYYYAGLSVHEIAALLKKSETAVYSLHARALRTLRDRLVERENSRIFRGRRLIPPRSREIHYWRREIDG